MAGSVWLKEIDTALKEKIPSIVKYYDEDSKLKPVEVVIRNPEGEFSLSEFPCVSFFNYNQRFADDRIDDIQEMVVSSDRERGKALIEPVAIPINLLYQIDFWSEYQIDMDEMTRRWVANTGKNFILDVLDSSGIPRKCVVNFVDYVKVDYTEENKRIFHRAYSYEIWVELDEKEAKEVDILTKLDIRRD